MSANENCSLWNRRNQRLEESAARRKLEAWLKESERLEAEASKWRLEEERIAAAHFSYVLQKQQVGGGRWFEIRRLRAIELRTNVIGLVLAEERWMRVLDTRLETQGIFIGSYTKKYLVDPELGVIPQLPSEH